MKAGNQTHKTRMDQVSKYRVYNPFAEFPTVASFSNISESERMLYLLAERCVSYVGKGKTLYEEVNLTKLYDRMGNMGAIVV